MRAFHTLAFVPLLFGMTASAQSAVSDAYPLSTDDAFCGRVQQFIAGTDLAVENVLYEEGSYWNTFKESKAMAQPLTTHQYVGYQFADGARAEFPVTVACKMKTAERIRTAYASTRELTVAEEDRECQKWQARMLDDVYRVLDEQGVKTLPRERITFAEEEREFIGPFWLRPEIYQVAYREGETLKLRTKSLHVEYRRFMPVPRSFMGTHYCTMIAPEYLAKLLQGEVEVPQLQE